MSDTPRPAGDDEQPRPGEAGTPADPPAGEATGAPAEEPAARGWWPPR
jgi:hypothetical protein